MTRAFTHAEIEAWKCRRRSGIEPSAKDFDRALLAIADLQREVVQANSRHREFVQASVEVGKRA